MKSSNYKILHNGNGADRLEGIKVCYAHPEAPIIEDYLAGDICSE